MSIRQRLPLLICILLLCIVISFGFLAYYGIRKAEIGMGRERLQSVANQLSTMFSQSTGNLLSSQNRTTSNDTLRQAVLSEGKTLDTEAKNILKSLRKDSTTALVELTDAKFQIILKYSEADSSLQGRLSLLKKDLASEDLKNGKVGNIYKDNGSMYVPIISPVNNREKVIGYIVTWLLLYNAPAQIEQFNQLLGKGANFYIGNVDGSLWTDLAAPVAKPSNAPIVAGNDLEYTNIKDDKVIAKALPVANTSWLVLVEFSKNTVVEGANKILKWILIIGVLLLIAGAIITRYMTRSITTPLNRLTDAASAISKGDYSQYVDVKRKDELGKLGMAFNTMAKEVNATQVDLEQKVAHRTEELETANKELEGFSYSVSHDLRAPLRGIIGFASMLEEKYAAQLDDEARRLTAIIKRNTLRMGNLIDDLLAFSKIGRDEMMKNKINTEAMVHDVIESLAPKNTHEKIQWKISDLPPITGDAKSIQQVWTNFISNAIKYSSRKEQPVIEIGSFTKDDQIAFFIKDNGVGFDEAYKDKLFNVFQRLHSMAEFEGTGIGLAIVEKIITKHEGHVWVEAKEGEGACFYFSLPA